MHVESAELHRDGGPRPRPRAGTAVGGVAPPAGLRRARTGTTPTVEPSSRPWPHPRSRTDRIAPPHGLQTAPGREPRRATPRSGWRPSPATRSQRGRGGLGGARPAPPPHARPGGSRHRRLVAVAFASSGPAYARRSGRCSSCRPGSWPRSSTGSTTGITGRSGTSPSTSCRSSSSGRSPPSPALALFLEVTSLADARAPPPRSARSRPRSSRRSSSAEPRALRLAADHAPRADRHRRRRGARPLDPAEARALLRHPRDRRRRVPRRSRDVAPRGRPRLLDDVDRDRASPRRDRRAR